MTLDEAMDWADRWREDYPEFPDETAMGLLLDEVRRLRALQQWRKVPDGSPLPSGSPLVADTTIYAFDSRGTWLYDLPPLPSPSAASSDSSKEK